LSSGDRAMNFSIYWKTKTIIKWYNMISVIVCVLFYYLLVPNNLFWLLLYVYVGSNCRIYYIIYIYIVMILRDDQQNKLATLPAMSYWCLNRTTEYWFFSYTHKRTPAILLYCVFCDRNWLAFHVPYLIRYRLFFSFRSRHTSGK